MQSVRVNRIWVGIKRKNDQWVKSDESIQEYFPNDIAATEDLMDVIDAVF